MLCISRVTDESIKQLFGDGRHSFYLEQRCNFPCVKGMDVCAKCVTKVAPYKTQGSRRFDHGKVNEPIPEHSHIFGGEWYQSRLKQWGTPPSEIIRFALQYQSEARQGYIVVDPDYSKERKGEAKQHQATQYKVDEQKKEVVSVMPRGRKPKVASEEKIEKTTSNVRDITIARDENELVSEKDTTEVKPVVKRRRPTVAVTPKNTETDVATTDKKDEKKSRGVTRKKGVVTAAEEKEQQKEVKTEAKKRAPRKQKEVPVVEPITNPLIVDQPIIFQEAVIPTMLEQDIEQVDTDGYEIEYITLREFELNNTTYYIESSKGKLYKKVKGGIGPYVGRYHKDLEEIDTSVPDSDDES